jgi:hypothetical protein
LTVTPASGYELNDLKVLKVPNDPATTVALTGSGATRTFTMPAQTVTVTATFKKTQAQLDKEAVEAAKAAIEGGAYRVAQGTANEQTAVRTWLENTLSVLFGQSHDLQLRASGTPIIGDVAITAVTPAIAGTEDNPNGVNGSFAFSVALTRGVSNVTATFGTGVIIATPHASTPVKRIELLPGNLTVRIINTGNIATGDLTLALSGANADVFTLPSTTVSSLAVSGEADITLTPNANLAAGTYTATLTVSGEGVTETVTITYTVTATGIADVETWRATSLHATSTNGGLQVFGLVPGEVFSIYNLSGQLVYKGKAATPEQFVPLNVRGIYIVVAGERRVKAVYK